MRSKIVQMWDHRFRSLVEAMWFVYFVEIGSELVLYEPFWFDPRPKDGLMAYTPDFFVVDAAGVPWVYEIKRSQISHRDAPKWQHGLDRLGNDATFVVVNGQPPGYWHLIGDNAPSLDWKPGPPGGLEVDRQLAAQVYQAVRNNCRVLQGRIKAESPTWEEFRDRVLGHTE